MPAGCRVESDRWLAVEVVVAVAGTSDTVDAADDDVCGQRVTGAEITIGVVGGADDLRAIEGDLSRRDGSRCRKEECLDEHVD